MPLRIIAISDTHRFHEKMGEIPDGDVLIHAGDMTGRGTVTDTIAVYEWLSFLPHPRIIFTPGNHDAIFEEKLREQFPRVGTLIDRYTDIDGMRVYGSTWQSFFRNWSFNFPPGQAAKSKRLKLGAGYLTTPQS
jgi:hypothetical protein